MMLANVVVSISLLACTFPLQFAQGETPAGGKIVIKKASIVAYGTAVKLELHKDIQFADFRFRFEGEESSPMDPNGPTVSATTRIFTVSDNQKKLQTLKVTTVQNAPEPLEFTVQKKTFVLYTYESPTGKRLFPHSFSIQAREGKGK